MFEHVEVELHEMEAVTTEEGRVYKTPEGIGLPSITTVLSILSRDSIEAWKKKVGVEEANKISHRAATRGVGGCSHRLSHRTGLRDLDRGTAHHRYRDVAGWHRMVVDPPVDRHPTSGERR